MLQRRRRRHMLVCFFPLHFICSSVRLSTRSLVHWIWYRIHGTSINANCTKPIVWITESTKLAIFNGCSLEKAAIHACSYFLLCTFHSFLALCKFNEENLKQIVTCKENTHSTITLIYFENVCAIFVRNSLNEYWFLFLKMAQESNFRCQLNCSLFSFTRSFILAQYFTLLSLIACFRSSQSHSLLLLSCSFLSLSSFSFCISKNFFGIISVSLLIMAWCIQYAPTFLLHLISSNFSKLEMTRVSKYSEFKTYFRLNAMLKVGVEFNSSNFSHYVFSSHFLVNLN